MSEFLLEIGCEEIPAGMLEPAIKSLQEHVLTGLQAAEVPFGPVSAYYTPRRLTLHISNLAEKQADRVEIVTGPPQAVCYDKDGHFTKAAQSFAERNNVPLKALKVTTTPRGEYMSVQKKIKGVRTAALLADLAPKVIAGISFPKSMYWTEDKFRFARPIRWVVALLDGRVVPFTVAGVRAGSQTAGHRMLGQRRIRLTGPTDYLTTLEKNCVVVDPAARRLSIHVGLEAAAVQVGGTVLPDDELEEIVTNLNEFPTVIHGQFDEAFLKLPKEVLVTVMRSHQKYFSVLGEHGELRPYFLAVINTDGDQKGMIRLGHERVLRARLADAQFFWETDTKRTLAERKSDLDHVLFQAELGTYTDKTQRIQALSQQIARDLNLGEVIESITKAASLAKVDLTTEMVKEFTDLQGIMGGLYAKHEGCPEQVWRAIYEHYQPKNLEEASPQSIEGAVLSIADKIDTIVGCFEAGLIPSGTRDPFALRRQGNGLLKVMLDHKMTLSLARLIHLAWLEYAKQGTVTAGRPEYSEGLLPFFEGRLRYILEMRGFPYDVINAVLARDQSYAPYDIRNTPYGVLQRAEALAKIRPEEDFLAIATAFKRIKNILRDPPQAGEPVVKSELLVEEAEKELYTLFETERPKVQELVKNLDYYAALKRIASMRQAVDRFFDKVLVMAEDAKLRTNRINLLRNMTTLFTQVADISEIVIEKTS